MFRLLNNRNFIFVLAIASGLFLPQATPWTTFFMMPALALVMALATLNVSNDYFRNLRAIIKPSVVGILMSYVILGGVILLLSTLLIENRNLWIGFVLIAAVPPAVAVIPFTAILKGNVSYTLSGTVASYLAALLIMPLIFWIFIGTGFNDPYKLLRIMFLLIVFPLIVSRVVLYFNWQEHLTPVRGPLTDWGFFIVFVFHDRRQQEFDFQPAVDGCADCRHCFLFNIRFGMDDSENMLDLPDRQERCRESDSSGHFKKSGIAGGLAIALF